MATRRDASGIEFETRVVAPPEVTAMNMGSVAGPSRLPPAFPASYQLRNRQGQMFTPAGTDLDVVRVRTRGEAPPASRTRGT